MCATTDTALTKTIAAVVTKNKVSKGFLYDGLKSLPEKVVGPGEPVGIRTDAQWNVPEPELALVINSHGTIVGYTIGNDMSSRDIEGENLLYLPQAKIYHRSCAVGPCIVVGSTETEARAWTITLQIYREGRIFFEGQTTVDQIKRRFGELVSYLCRSQTFPYGAVLLTGTGIVPGEDFTLQAEDRVPDRGQRHRGAGKHRPIGLNDRF
jgi:2-dehydro-3-deoxy-D-arabinonate dehydratase